MILLRPVILYGFKTSTLRKTDELRQAIFARKVLRKIHGPVFDNEIIEWRKVHSFEREMLFQRPDIIKEIVKRRLMRAGHV